MQGTLRTEGALRYAPACGAAGPWEAVKAYQPGWTLRAVGLCATQNRASRYHARKASEVRSFFRHLSKNDAASGCDCAVLAIRMAWRERRERNGDQAGATGDDEMASEGRPVRDGRAVRCGGLAMEGVVVYEGCGGKKGWRGGGGCLKVATYYLMPFLGR